MSTSKAKLGILGGGQLAWLLALAAIRRNIPVISFSSNMADPVFKLKEVESASSFTELARKSSRVIFENEFIDLAEVQGSEFTTKFFPAPESLDIFQDKLLQKKKLDELKISSAKYLVYQGGDLKDWIQIVLKSEVFENKDLVFKWSRHAYDGRGNFVFSRAQSKLEDLISFIRMGLGKKASIYVEEKIDFQLELAASICRLGEQKVFLPLVVSIQKAGVCSVVKGPAQNFGVPSAVEQEAQSILSRCADAVGIEGCLAAEFFWSSEAGLLVNELAPRVHNSAHYSSDALSSSQFDLQVQAAVSFTLPERLEIQSPFFGMRNLLSPSDAEFSHPSGVFSIPVRNANFYWYGKSELRKNRKMGHVNFWADSLEELEGRLLEILKWEEKFWQTQKSN